LTRADLVYGDALLRLSPVSRRAQLVGRKPNDLQDAQDFIEQSGMAGDFVALQYVDVWIVQLSRDSQQMRKLLMFAKMRFG
jgi:hypothetical protein